MESNVVRRRPRAVIALSASVFAEGLAVATHAVVNLSASGVLLAGVPPVGAGGSIVVRFELAGFPTVTVAGAIVRLLEPRTGEHMFAVCFQHASIVTEDVLIRAVDEALAKERMRGHATVVLVAPDGTPDPKLVGGLAELGYHVKVVGSTRASFPTLQDPTLRVEALLIDSGIVSANGADFLTVLAEDFPWVRRILVAPELAVDELELTLSGSAQHVLISPWAIDELSRLMA